MEIALRSEIPTYAGGLGVLAGDTLRSAADLGLPLVETVSRELAIDIELFSRGGQEILRAIERQGFDVLRSRPVISKTRKLLLVARAAAGKLR